MRPFRMAAALAACSVLALLAACAPAAPGDKSGGQPSPTPTPIHYATTTFGIPFEVTVPPEYAPAPDTDAAHFVTWQPKGLPAIRFLNPISVYKPGAAAPTGVPKDYLHYLLGQTSSGAEFTDRKEVAIDGRSATTFTANTTKQTNGSIGCWQPGQPAAECFGFQVPLTLRMAVLDVDGRPLAIWLRQSAGVDPTDAAQQAAEFDAMLTTLHFR